MYCKVVIYNYVLSWLYFMTKSVVIALFLFLVFYGILLYWVYYEVGEESSVKEELVQFATSSREE